MTAANRPFVSARPRLNKDGQVPKREMRASVFVSAHVPPKGLTKRKASEAAADFDALCAARPLKPPTLPKDNDTRSAGACELAREIRRGTFTP